MRLILIFLITLSLPAFAQVYKWTDENGVTHFGSQPPPGDREQVKIRDNRMGPSQAPAVVQTAKPEEEQSQSTQDRIAELEQSAWQRACDLAKHELASAERKLTLALSIDRNSPMVDHRNSMADLWKRRTRIECIGAE